MADKWVDSYSTQLPKIRAENELRLFNLLAHILPARSDEETDLRKSFVRALEREILGKDEPVGRISMPVKDTVAMGMLSGLVEVVEGPPIDHGIGTRKAGFRSDDDQQ